jgi:uncharacterized protein YxeA
MKQILISISLFVLLLTNNRLMAQSFTVKVPSTDNFQNYIVPLRVGAEHTLEVKVTNNDEHKSYVVTINKSVMGNVEPWITITNNNYE